MFDFLMMLLIWFLVLIDPMAFDAVSGLTPDQCTFYEDGATICRTFELPAYDEVR